MSGQTFFASALWSAIPASPLGPAANGPVQSIDTRHLWWWTATQIAEFNLETQKWSGPWAWDGSAPTCISQYSGGNVLMAIASGTGGDIVVYRVFSPRNNNWRDIPWITGNSGNVYDFVNSEYTGYLGSPFQMSSYGNFAYDPIINDKVVSLVTDGYGDPVQAFQTINIQDGSLSRGIFMSEELGSGGLALIQPGGLMGNPNVVFGWFQAGGLFGPYVTIKNGTIGEQTTIPQSGNQTSMVSNFGARTYTFAQSTNWTYPDPLPIPAIPNFIENLPIILADTEYGGWLGPNTMFLKASKYPSGNPKTFTFIEFVLDENDGGIFLTPFPVNYNPLGDANIEFAGFEGQVFVGEAGSTDWFTLSVAAVEFNLRSVSNYRWQGLKK